MIRKSIIKNIGFPLMDVAKQTNVVKHFKLYKKLSGKSKKEVRDYQFEKLKKLLHHAYKNVPFYKDRFDKIGVKVESIKDIEDLKRIPVLTRADIQNNFNNLYARNIDIRKCSKGCSSGSTGLPVQYLHDKSAKSAGTAANYFGWALSGWGLGEKGLHIWGNPRIVSVEWNRLSSKLKSYMLRHHKYPAYQLTEDQKFYELANKLIKGKYDFIDGYTNAIYLLAKYINQNDIESPKVNRVFTTAENLQDYQRIEIERVLGKVYDQYGCGEINGISFQCQYCNEYHNIDPHVIVEYTEDILGDDGSSSLAITDLDNYVMPLIRYMNGDMGVPGKNSDCIIPFSSIASVSGRISDIIEIPGGGNLVVPSFFGSMLLKQVKGIKQYQIEKTEHTKIQVNLVVDNDYKEEYEKVINASLSEYLSGNMEWSISYQDQIALSKTGKYKLLVDRTKK